MYAFFLRIEKGMPYFLAIEKVCFLCYVSQKLCFLEYEPYMIYASIPTYQRKYDLFCT